VNLFGYTIERNKGARVGSYQVAIEDLQARVASLEARMSHRNKKADERDIQNASVQSEIDRILHSGGNNRPGNLWDTLSG